MSEDKKVLNSKDDTLYYLRHCLREIANVTYEQDLETTIKVGQLTDDLRDAILWVETKCPND